MDVAAFFKARFFRGESGKGMFSLVLICLRLQVPTAKATNAPTADPTRAPTTPVPSGFPTTWEEICKLPANLGDGIEGGAEQGSDAQACSGGMTLGNDHACYVRCKEGYYDAGGTSAYKCPNRFLERATLVCLEINEMACQLPAYTDGVVGVGLHPCPVSKGSGPGIKPPFLPLGATCNVGCAAGYALNDGSDEYRCHNTTKELSLSATLSCTKNLRPARFCTLPWLGFGISGDCQAGARLLVETACSVRCREGWVSKRTKLNNEEGIYACKTQLQIPPLECEHSDAKSNPLGIETHHFSLELHLPAADEQSFKDFGQTQVTNIRDMLAAKIVAPQPSQLTVEYTKSLNGKPPVFKVSLKASVSASVVSTAQINAALVQLEAYSESNPFRSQYTVTSASLNEPTLLKRVETCTLPAAFARGVIAPALHCQPGMTIAKMQSCAVQCKAGWTRAGGDGKYGCYQSLQEATLKCQPGLALLRGFSAS